MDVSEYDAKSWTILGVPSLLIVNCMIPDYAPTNPIWRPADADGKGWSLVFFFELTEQTAAELAKKNPETTVPAVRLLRDFVNADDKSPLRQRFKGIARVTNLESPSVELNSVAKRLVHSYNATPFLIRTCFSAYKGSNYFEINADVHNFSYLCLVGLNNLKDTLTQIKWDFGFVIEAHGDDQMPECMLGAASLSQLDLQSVKPLPLHALPLPSTKTKPAHASKIGK